MFHLNFNIIISKPTITFFFYLLIYLPSFIINFPFIFPWCVVSLTCSRASLLQFLIKCDNNEARRALKMDLVCLLVLTPLALCSVYLCCVSAIQYVNQKQVSFSVFTDEPSRLYKSRKRLEQVGYRLSVVFIIIISIVTINNISIHHHHHYYYYCCYLNRYSFPPLFVLRLVLLLLSSP